MIILECYNAQGKILSNYDYFTIVPTDLHVIIYLVVPDNTVVKYRVKNKWHLLYKPCDLTFPDNIVVKADPDKKLPNHYIGTYWPGVRGFSYNKNYTGPYKIYENL